LPFIRGYFSIGYPYSPVGTGLSSLDLVCLTYQNWSAKLYSNSLFVAYEYSYYRVESNRYHQRYPHQAPAPPNRIGAYTDCSRRSSLASPRICGACSNHGHYYSNTKSFDIFCKPAAPPSPHMVHCT
jgi:hypothetical protein